jgi:hypothetical protein
MFLKIRNLVIQQLIEKPSQDHECKLGCHPASNMLLLSAQLNTHAFRKEASLTRQVTLGGMVQNRKQHREPVIRALLALPLETVVEVAERCLPSGGLCVSARTTNRKQHYVNNYFVQWRKGH